MGRTRLSQRRGATDAELQHSRRDIMFGMLFSNIVMYFIILAAASTLYATGQHEITTAAQAAKALKPLAGNLAGTLFALGVVAVGFLAVPVMTTGARLRSLPGYGVASQPSCEAGRSAGVLSRDRRVHDRRRGH